MSVANDLFRCILGMSAMLGVCYLFIVSYGVPGVFSVACLVFVNVPLFPMMYLVCCHVPVEALSLFHCFP